MAVISRNVWIQNELAKSLDAQKVLVEGQNKVLEETVAPSMFLIFTSGTLWAWAVKAATARVMAVRSFFMVLIVRL